MVILRPLLLFIACIGYISAQEWDASSYPNPTTSTGFKQCNMRSTSNLCDPDQILSESDRYRLNSELNQLESRTRQEHGRNYCEKKGITGAIALARKVRGGTQQAVQEMANDMLRKWVLDRQCLKAIVIVISVDDRKFWIARGAKVPVYGQELTNIFNAQKQLFASGDHSRALQNILQAIIDATLSKQGPGTGPAPGGGDRRPVQPQPGYPGDPGKREGFKWPISPWILLAIVVFVVIPLLCCCCCLYFCCFRNKDGNRSDTGDGGGRRGGGFGNIGSILSGLGGGAAANAIMNRFRNRGGGGGGAPAGGYPPQQGGGTYPSSDPYAGGKQPGLYPSAPKEDQGGGGGW